MVRTRDSRSLRVRSRLSHPVIDADGHILELTPVLLDYVRDVGGSRMAERYARPRSGRDSFSGGSFGAAEERRDGWLRMYSWWISCKDTLDRATAMMPRLLNERLEEFGIDFAVLYPTEGLGTPAIEDPELRQVACRALNSYMADMVRVLSDRMTPTAMVPLDSPEEAIRELEYAVTVLGFKSIAFQGSVRRPIPRLQREHPEASGFAGRLELFALDSDYDYDPVWAKCLELKVAATFHSLIQAMGTHSISNYVYNPIGILAGGHAGLCKALFLGGVTRRFPKMRFAFLEGGVSWACALFSDLVGHWEKRNGTAILELDPARLDQDLLARMVREYGNARTAARAAELEDYLRRDQPRPHDTDDFAACKITRAEEVSDLFVPSFYFGCEADDPMNATAFHTADNPFSARLRAIFGSDLGHWDVPVMSDVLYEAYESVERGAITQEDFRDFTFTNAVRLHTDVNPDFFKGTRIEGEVAEMLKS